MVIYARTDGTTSVKYIIYGSFANNQQHMLKKYRRFPGERQLVSRGGMESARQRKIRPATVAFRCWLCSRRPLAQGGENTLQQDIAWFRL